MWCETGFRKDKGARDQIVNIHWIIEKARKFQKNIYLCFTDYTKAFDCVQFSFRFVAQSCPTLQPSGLQHTRLPCPSPYPRAYSNSSSSSQWCHPAILSSVIPFSFCLQSFPTLGSFPVSQLFAWGGQSIGISASASVLPMNTQDWSLGITGWISLQSKGLSRVFSNTTVQKHKFFSTQLSLYSNSHIHTWLLEKPHLWLDGPLLVK